MTTILTPTLPAYTGEPGATLDWPTAEGFSPARISWGVMANKTAWGAAYTGQTQSITHLADRLRLELTLPPCSAAAAGAREAFCMAAVTRGHWLRLWHFARPAPLGTLRGTPTVSVAAAAGARSILVATTAGATLAAGDVLGGNNQLLQCAYGGAVADGAGLMDVELALPLRRALASGAALQWSKPTGTFQILAVDPTFEYQPGIIQQGLVLTLAEVYT
jgi:hypothetical protein